MKREENRKLSAFGGSESARGERLVWQAAAAQRCQTRSRISQWCSTTAVLVVVAAVDICV